LRHRHHRNRVGSFLPLPSGSSAQASAPPRASGPRSAALPPARTSLEPCRRIPRAPFSPPARAFFPLSRCLPFPDLAGVRRRPELPGAPPQSLAHTSLHQQLTRSELNFSCKYPTQSLSVSNLAARGLQFHLPPHPMLPRSYNPLT